MAYQQTNTKLKTYFKTDSNNKNIFGNSHLTLTWKALHAAIKDNQNKLDMYFVKFTEPAARDLQAFLVFSQHPAWVYHAGKLIEKVFYCLNKLLFPFHIVV